MFGLTKREQRWKAEERACSMIFDLMVDLANANAAIEIAKSSKTESEELKELREQNRLLRLQIEQKAIRK